MKFKFTAKPAAKWAFFLLFLPFVEHASAQTKQGNAYVFATGKEQARLEFCSPAMFRVRVSKDGKFTAEEHLMQDNYTAPWWQVLLAPPSGGPYRSGNALLSVLLYR